MLQTGEAHTNNYIVLSFVPTGFGKRAGFDLDKKTMNPGPIYLERAMAHDLDNVLEILKKKKEDYGAYKFKAKETMAIFAFFDLAQEFASLDNLYRISVAVVKFFFDLESCIYTIRAEDGMLMMNCCSTDGLLDPPVPAGPDVALHDIPYRSGSSFLFPVIGKKALSDKVPLFLDNQMLGMFEIYPVENLSNHELLFFQKYANRVGYNMHNKLAVEQNLEHIRFINQLVSDIEHNVITPNLYYKAFLLNMKKYLKRHLSKLESLGSIISGEGSEEPVSEKQIAGELDELKRIHQDMDKKMEEFESHFKHLSLFIETLFRGDHFKTGGYVLKRRTYNLLKDIFLPELEHYRQRLEHRGIEIIYPEELPSDKELSIFIDLGLTAQVFANLLSNAMKYCEPRPDYNGKYRSCISYNVELLGKDSYDTHSALKFSIFTSGKPLSTREAILAFEDGYKVAKHGDKEGSGHGLHFVKNIVHLHGGHAGCKPRDNGNEFYIILPKFHPDKTRQG